ncbi:MAG: tryptophan-rich sensory protein [Gammaproteobacteria bacterium]|nr:tryptophan-rich sensory protein [Gammaproteobacteria bacterium]
MRTPLFLSCIVWVSICLVISGFSGWVSSSHISGWYQTLNQPSFSPPSWIFGPAWTLLYVTIGIAGGFLWQHRKKFSVLFSLFILQLAFNFAWSFIFFVGENISWALLDILGLWLSLACLIVIAMMKARNIAWLLLPYFFWVSFAAVLNYAVWLLN